MIIQFHIPRKRAQGLKQWGYPHLIELYPGAGVVSINSETVTDIDLAKISMTREDFNRTIPRNLVAEIDALKSENTELNTKLKQAGIIV